jgi:hypothetical protein
MFDTLIEPSPVVVLGVAGSNPVTHPEVSAGQRPRLHKEPGPLTFQCPILGAIWERTASTSPLADVIRRAVGVGAAVAGASRDPPAGGSAEVVGGRIVGARRARFGVGWHWVLRKGQVPGGAPPGTVGSVSGGWLRGGRRGRRDRSRRPGSATGCGLGPRESPRSRTSLLSSSRRAANPATG